MAYTSSAPIAYVPGPLARAVAAADAEYSRQLADFSDSSESREVRLQKFAARVFEARGSLKGSQEPRLWDVTVRSRFELNIGAGNVTALDVHSYQLIADSAESALTVALAAEGLTADDTNKHISVHCALSWEGAENWDNAYHDAWDDDYWGDDHET